MTPMAAGRPVLSEIAGRFEIEFGGSDGTRTRGLLRDRQAF